MKMFNVKFADVVQERDELRREVNRLRHDILVLEAHKRFEPQPETLVMFADDERFVLLMKSLGGGFFS